MFLVLISNGQPAPKTTGGERRPTRVLVGKARHQHQRNMAVPVEEFFAGSSSTALKRVHRQRLMAFGVVLVGCTLVSWILVILCWQLTPSTRGPGSRILADFLSIMVVALCHSLAVFSRYLVCDADDAPRRRAASGGFSYSALALPNLGQGLATIVAHWLIGMALGFFAWNFAAPRG
ncbi:unnamed protein product, partial [Ectocarpus sp. 13 AM-2016]